MDPNLIVWFIGGVSFIAGLLIFLVHLCNRKLHKNPCNLKLLRST